MRIFDYPKISRAYARAILLLTIATSLMVSRSATAQGIVVFESDQDWDRLSDTSENSEIYLVSPGDKKSVRLTSDPEADGVSSLSAGGSHLFFVSTRTGKVEIYVMKISPQIGRLQSVVSKDEFASNPTPSADGRLLAFISRNAKEQWLNTLDLKSGTRKNVTPVVGVANEITFVPDNRRIIFTTTHPGSGGRDLKDIWIVNIDGTQRKLIGRGSTPNCNPQGDRVTFARSGSICTMGLDGSDVRQITPLGSSDGDPCYSPDGANIVFFSDTRLRSARGIFASEALGKRIGSNIYIMKNDGTQLQRITFGVGDDTQPTWSVKYAVPYVPPSAPQTTPDPQIQFLTQTPASEPLQKGTENSNKGQLIYAFNDLKTAPYSSFLGAQTDGKTQNFQLQGPRLQGTDGDFVFDPQSVPGSDDVLIKLGDPAVRPDNPYNSYHLWQWNRQTNALTSAAPRELFFRQVSPSPDEQRVAYIAGGNALAQTPEENGGIGEPLRLYVYDAKTQTETLVSDNEGVRGGFAWLDAQTLLYTAVPTPEKSALNPRAFARPAIYSFDVAAVQSTLLINEARHPLPSPDGKRFAFWGLREDEEALPLPDNWWQKTGFASLGVVERDGSGRKGFGRMPGLYPSLTWAPDNERLLIVGRAGSRQGHIEEWNTAKGNVREIATIVAKDAQPVERTWFQPQLRALNVSPDGKTLFVAVEEVDKQNQVISRVQEVDLETGKMTLVAQLKDASGFDWRPNASE